MKIKSIKTGMLFSIDIIETVVSFLGKYKVPLIVDPVMIAASGDLLIKKSALDAVKEKLLPLATLLTPNLSEAEYLLKCTLDNRQAIEQAARELCNMGSKAVLIKGGHSHRKTSDDCLYIKKGKNIHWFRSKRIITKNTHGTGCTLSAAIAAFLAQGNQLLDAVDYAKKYITKALIEGSKYSIGHGCGPVHHFYKSWQRE
jgi:hydroxymethylpyrimidine/phosphomethylpyrimidine kinase